MTDDHTPGTNDLDDRTLACLRVLAERYPTSGAVLAEIAQLTAALVLPKGTVHVVSDVHGEWKKLRHIINNASGSLRPLVERTVGERLDDTEKTTLLTFLYYPREAWAHAAPELPDVAARRGFLRRMVRLEIEIMRALARTRTSRAASAIVPDHLRAFFRELVSADQERPLDYLDALLEPFVREGRELDVLRALAHAIRNLSVSEIVVAGDPGDRGSRIDKVIDILMHQPNVSFAWGNHDVSWIGACLGHEALIATVLRISLRYRRLSQLEEGYGVPAAPVEKLARTVYGDDPAERFACKGEGLRDPLLMARMQKAMAVVQFKLEGQLLRRNPSFGMAARDLLSAIDYERGTVRIDGALHPLLDGRLPTVDPRDPLRLSDEETACIARLRQSFLESSKLWEQMKFVVERGKMLLRRDDAVIFHACIPTAPDGTFLSMDLAGTGSGNYRGNRALSGRALFDAFEGIVRRSLHGRATEDLDHLWYLWAGPLSPLFGKDKMATFETYFVADKATHKEQKNPYFKLINDRAFCDRVLDELSASPERGLIVNGHVPVRVEKGEAPLKDSGKAITIDGAFSEAYGDRGYTLVLSAERTYLAEHHHFESVSDAITRGSDILPTVQAISTWGKPRTVADTEEGRVIRNEIAILEQLLEAYASHAIAERG